MLALANALSAHYSVHAEEYARSLWLKTPPRRPRLACKRSQKSDPYLQVELGLFPDVPGRSHGKDAPIALDE